MASNSAAQHLDFPVRKRATRRAQSGVVDTRRLVDDAIRYGPLSRLKLLITLFARHGRFGQVLLWSVFGPPMYLFTRACMWIDLLFYPQLRTMTVDRPVFILGHPRSGSTFLQRAVHKSGRAMMFKTWELWFPSLVQRKLVRPVLSLLRLLGLKVLQGPEYGHEIRLDGIEEDEGLFLHQLDTEMLTFICPQSVTDSEFREIGLRFGRLGPRQTRRSMRFYRACLKRQILWTGIDRPVVKCNPSVFRIPWVLETFPDARFVYLVRDPADGIRSFLALNRRHVAPLMSSRDERRYYRRKYRWSVDLYKAFEANRATLRDNQLLEVRFTDLTRDPESSLKRFFRFAEIGPSDAYWQAVRRASTSTRRRKHSNPALGSFGLRRSEIESELGFVVDRYLGTG